MTDQMNSKPTLPAGGTKNEGEIRTCKICGEELTEDNHSKEKEGVCLDCEGRGDGDLDDHTQTNVNRDGIKPEESL